MNEKKFLLVINKSPSGGETFEWAPPASALGVLLLLSPTQRSGGGGSEQYAVQCLMKYTSAYAAFPATAPDAG